MTEIDAAVPPLAYALPVTPTATERSRTWAMVRQILWAIALVIVLAGFVWCLHLYYATAINHPDANGYWAQGSLMAEQWRTYLKPESNAAYIGMHWLMLGDNFFISRYPPGFPMVIGLVQEIFGWRATFLINPVLAIATLIGMYLIVARLTSAGWGLLAVIVLGFNPPFAVHALTEISHMPVAFCVVWGVYLLMRWSESGWVWWVFVAGLVLGCIPSTRYADSVVAIGVAAFLLMHVTRFPKIWKHYLYAAGGAAIPILPLLIRNQLMFGKFWATGYTLTNESSGFGWDYFQQHAIGYLQSLQAGGLGVMFALGLIGMIWMLCIARTRAMSLMLLLSAVPFIMVYMAYYWAMGIGGGGGNVGGALRFMVPIVPLFIIPGIWALDQMFRAAPLAARIAIPIVLVALQLTMYISPLREELRNGAERKSMMAMATDAMEQSIPEGSVVVADQSLLQHLDFVRKWKLADSSLVSDRQGRGGVGGGPGGMQGGNNNRGRFQGAGAGGPPGGMGGPPGAGGPDGNDQDQPSPRQRDKTEARMKLYTGTTEQKQDKFLDDLVKWAGDKDVYVVGKESELQRLLPGTKNLKIVKRIKTPEPPPEPQQANGFGRGGGFGNNRMRGGGGPFGSFVQPGEEFVIAKW